MTPCSTAPTAKLRSLTCCCTWAQASQCNIAASYIYSQTTLRLLGIEIVHLLASHAGKVHCWQGTARDSPWTTQAYRSVSLSSPVEWPASLICKCRAPPLYLGANLPAMLYPQPTCVVQGLGGWGLATSSIGPPWVPLFHKKQTQQLVQARPWRRLRNSRMLSPHLTDK